MSSVKRWTQHFSLVIIALWLTACATSEVTTPPPRPQPSKPKPAIQTPKPSTEPQNTNVQQPLTIEDQLMDQYHDWRGTPYRYGGLSRAGVDCSGFVYLTYKQLFSIHLPRTTRLQSGLGRKVSLAELSEGDLLFFRREHGLRHVGIYIADDYFLHASTSHGVILSRLSEDYWQRHFWVAKRLLN